MPQLPLTAISRRNRKGINPFPIQLKAAGVCVKLKESIAKGCRAASVPWMLPIEMRGIRMNGKFFDLKKEKQDRMINAALKSFALQGYLHANTDQIVKDAGISKGLLFHYFETKLGLYSFAYEYSVRYMLLELDSVIGQKKPQDLFDTLRQVETAHVRVLRAYPYMRQFLNRSMYEDVAEALLAVENLKNQLNEAYAAIYRRIDYSSFPAGIDGRKLRSMMELAFKGLMTERIMDASFQPEMLYREICVYIDWMRELVGAAGASHGPSPAPVSELDIQ